MANTPDFNAEPDDPPTPIDRPGPKRGAFPTPKSEIEKAQPYIPETAETDDCEELEPEPPAGGDGTKER